MAIDFCRFGAIIIMNKGGDSPKFTLEFPEISIIVDEYIADRASLLLTHLTQNVPKVPVNRAYLVSKSSGRCVTSVIDLLELQAGQFGKMCKMPRENCNSFGGFCGGNDEKYY